MLAARRGEAAPFLGQAKDLAGMNLSGIILVSTVINFAARKRGGRA